MGEDEGGNASNPVVKWLIIAAAIIVALTALVTGVKHFGEAVKPEPKKPAPILAATDVGTSRAAATP